MKKILYVVPLYGTSVLRRNEARFTMPNGNVLRKDSNRAGGVVIPVQFTKDNSTGKLNTGLSEIIDNPWHEDMKPNYDLLGSKWKLKEAVLKSKIKISLQTFYEIKFDLDEFDLSDRSGVKTMGQMNLKSKREFENQNPTMLDDFFYPFDFDHYTALDSDRSLEEALAIQVALNNPKIIAESRDVANINTHKFYIVTEEQGLDFQQTERRKTQKALAKLEDLMTNASDFTKYQMAINLELTRDSITETQVIKALEDYLWIQKKTEHGKLEDRVSKFNNYYQLLKSDSAKFEVEYMFRQALNKGIIKISTSDGNYYWPLKRQLENFYKLGHNANTIKSRIFNDRKSYDETIDTENMYGMLNDDLADNNVRLN